MEFKINTLKNILRHFYLLNKFAENFNIFSNRKTKSICWHLIRNSCLIYRADFRMYNTYSQCSKCVMPHGFLSVFYIIYFILYIIQQRTVEGVATISKSFADGVTNQIFVLNFRISFFLIYLQIKYSLIPSYLIFFAYIWSV